MNTYIQTIVTIAVTNASAIGEDGSPLYSSESTHVTVVDEGGGPFLEIETHDPDCGGKIRLNMDELEAIVKVARGLISQPHLKE